MRVSCAFSSRSVQHGSTPYERCAREESGHWQRAGRCSSRKLRPTGVVVLHRGTACGRIRSSPRVCCLRRRVNTVDPLCVQSGIRRSRGPRNQALPRPEDEIDIRLGSVGVPVGPVDGVGGPVQEDGTVRRVKVQQVGPDYYVATRVRAPPTGLAYLHSPERDRIDIAPPGISAKPLERWPYRRGGAPVPAGTSGQPDEPLGSGFGLWPPDDRRALCEARVTVPERAVTRRISSLGRTGYVRNRAPTTRPRRRRRVVRGTLMPHPSSVSSFSSHSASPSRPT